jgi:hypothetical protein
MRVGCCERIEIRVAASGVAVEALLAGLRGRGAPRIDNLEVTARMRIALTADASAFSIDARSTKDQFVRQGTSGRWDFDVTPLRHGRHRLRLLASMRVSIEGKDEVVDLPSYKV